MNKLKKYISLWCVLCLMTTLVSGCGEAANAMTLTPSGDALLEKPVIEDELSLLDEAVSTLDTTGIIKHSSESGKEETVYAILDADAQVVSTIVSDWVKNPEASTALSDVSDLDNIVVVKGDTTYTEDGNNLVWNGDGSDIYYQGTSDKELPVTVHVSYELDGKQVSANELAGADGHLKITFTYDNNTAKETVVDGKSCTIYQPFVLVSGVLLDNDKAVNVSVSNGSCINSGDNTVVFGMALPMLAESLGIDDDEDIDIDIPEDVVIEADVTDFELMMTLTVASNTALDQINIGSNDSIDELKSDMSELSDGMDEIVDGTGKLTDGVGELSDGTGKLTDGVNELDDGVIQLKDGANQLADGAASLLDGADQVNTGAGSLKDGAQQVNEGAAAIASGLNELNSSAPALAEGIGNLKTGSESLSTGLDTIAENNDTINSGMSQLAAGIAQLNTSLTDENAQAQLTALVSGSESIASGLDSVSNGLSNIEAAYNACKSNSVNITDEAKAALIDYCQKLASGSDEDKLVGSYISDLLTIAGYYQGTYDAVAQVSAGASTLKDNYSAIDGGIKSAVSSIGTVAQAAGQLNTGAQSLVSGISAYTAGVSEAATGMTSLKLGLEALNEKVPALTSGIQSLSDGASTLSTGTASLFAGAQQLSSGTQALFEGTASLKDGTDSLASGTVKLADGSSQLKNGVSDLADGVRELLEGTSDLNEGVIKYKQEGIDKLTELVNEDLDKYMDRFDAVKEYAKEYNNFSGCNDGVDCTVKFIYKTDSITSK